MEQMALFEMAMIVSCKLERERKNAKRRWEYAFQKWSDDQAHDGLTSLGVCGYGSMCDWCEDNTYGKPCVRALNKMCREKRVRIDYADRNSEKLWYEGVVNNEVNAKRTGDM